ncbi:MAG: GNAT family N-acetyltransferase [Pseudomonadota bacterium]
MKPRFEVRRESKSEFAVAVEWARREGWNPGLHDLDAFFAADPGGFFMGFLDEHPISSISVVRYGAHYGFLGFYIVLPEFRSGGYGLKTWERGLEHLGSRTIGLDGVLAQQDNYQRSGFEFSGRNIRCHGHVRHDATFLPSVVIRAATPDLLFQLLEMDTRLFGASRADFLKEWMFPPPDAERLSFVAMSNDELLGYGTIRNCEAGYKIGPLMALSFDIANALFEALCQTCPEGADVYLDVPLNNPDALTLAHSKNMSEVFETARMYRGQTFETDLSNVFGITTFELG